MKSELFKGFIKTQKISFDLTKLYVQEYYNIAMCFKCCNFENVAKYCKAPNFCRKCMPRLPKLHKLRLSEKKHSARDINCPAYILQVKKHRNFVNYLDLKQNF